MAAADSPEEQRARDLARHLGIDHDVINLSTRELESLARRSIADLGATELWEIGSAIAHLAVFDRVRELREPGLVFAGQGADVLLAGELFFDFADLDINDAMPDNGLTD